MGLGGQIGLGLFCHPYIIYIILNKSWDVRCIVKLYGIIDKVTFVMVK